MAAHDVLFRRNGEAEVEDALIRCGIADLDPGHCLGCCPQGRFILRLVDETPFADHVEWSVVHRFEDPVSQVMTMHPLRLNQPVIDSIEFAAGDEKAREPTGHQAACGIAGGRLEREFLAAANRLRGSSKLDPAAAAKEIAEYVPGVPADGEVAGEALK